MTKPEFKNISLDLLSRGKFQSREEFSDTYISELAESIKENGIIQPIIVRPIANKEYEIIAGECRWRAAQKAMLDEVPCLVRKYSDEQAVAATAIENIQRKNLNPIEEANAYQKFIDEFGYLHEEVAVVVGKSRTKITNSLRLLKLDGRVQDMLVKELISEGHGKVLAGLSAKTQFVLAQRSHTKGWSVRKIEQEAKKIQQGAGIVHGEDPNILNLEKIISEQVGTSAKIEEDVGSRGGWLKIKYFSNETLAGLLDKLGVEYD